MRERHECNILLEGIGIEGQGRLYQSRTLIVGVGGVGTFAALGLAGLGVNLGLCDRDVVEPKNLNRQFLYCENDIGKSKVEMAKKRIIGIDGNLKVRTYGNIGEASPQDFDVVVDCTDNLESRIAVSRMCKGAGRPLVYASAVGYEARVAVFRRRYLHEIAIIGDYSKDCGSVGIFPPAAMAAGSIAASESAKVILGKGDGAVSYTHLTLPTKRIV